MCLVYLFIILLYYEVCKDSISKPLVHLGPLEVLLM